MIRSPLVLLHAQQQCLEALRWSCEYSATMKMITLEDRAKLNQSQLFKCSGIYGIEWRIAKLKLSNELEHGGIHLWNDVRYIDTYIHRSRGRCLTSVGLAQARSNYSILFIRCAHFVLFAAVYSFSCCAQRRWKTLHLEWRENMVYISLSPLFPANLQYMCMQYPHLWLSDEIWHLKLTQN